MVGDGRRTEITIRVFDHVILYYRPINICSSIREHNFDTLYVFTERLISCVMKLPVQ